MKIIFLLSLSLMTSLLIGAPEKVQCDNQGCNCTEETHCGCLSPDQASSCACPSPVKLPAPQ